jgi:hypothetical protein
MKKAYIVISTILLLVTLMYAEYLFIMENLHPYYADGYVFIEFMGQTDTYYMESLR